MESGKRLIKLNNQAQEIISNLELWDYTKDFVSHKFKKEARSGIPDIRFHDKKNLGWQSNQAKQAIYDGNYRSFIRDHNRASLCAFTCY